MVFTSGPTPAISIMSAILTPVTLAMAMLELMPHVQRISFIFASMLSISSRLIEYTWSTFPPTLT